MPILVAIAHKNREPFRSTLQHHLSRGWLSSNVPEGLEVVVYCGKKLSGAGDFLDRLHERARWTPYLSSLVYRFDRLLASTRPWVVPSYEVVNRLGTGIVSVQIATPPFLMFSSLHLLGIFRYFLEETSAKHLFTTTSGNHIRPERLLSLSNDLAEEGCYAGTVLDFGEPFVSGANRLMSRDVVTRLVESVGELDAGVLEDVAFGRVVATTQIPFLNLETLNLQSIGDLDCVTDDQLANLHQIRVKSLSNRVRNDTELLRRLDDRFRVIDRN